MFLYGWLIMHKCSGVTLPVQTGKCTIYTVDVRPVDGRGEEGAGKNKH